ncbi:MAG: NAD(P)-dependent alcohol dehydrogenase [Brevundimonas sp.]|nr:MAG: NAD(P)-dependent alcohol dehydrogenase [Brevundimonas sp.]
MKSIAWGAKTALSKLERMEIERPEPQDHEVVIEVLYAGVCHSDIHQVKNEWANTLYPCVPGHEIVGRIKSTGSATSRFKEGDLVGVGCMIDSCRACEPCSQGDQNYCEGPNGWLATYNGPMTPATETLDPKAAAPILCAGVTTWSPMQHWGIGPEHHVAVLGLGGLGHMAVKLAKAMGCTVTVLTSTPEKLDEAKTLGADNAVLSTDKTGLAAFKGAFDFILSTVPEKHEVGPLLDLMKRDGDIVVVGNLDVIDGVDNSKLAFRRQSVSGSLIGNLDETQDVLDFCAANGIAPEVQMIDIQDINETYVKIENGEARYRYVIDMKSLS